MSKNMKNQQGFTLVEVLLSIVILAIIIIPLFNFFVQSMYNTKSSQQHTLATYAARNTLVFIEQQSFDSFIKFLVEGTGKDFDTLLVAESEKKIDYDVCIAKHYDLFGIDDANKESVCRSFFKPTFNNMEYSVIAKISKHESLAKYLIPVSVWVEWDDVKRSNKTREIEGVISDEAIRYEPEK